MFEIAKMYSKPIPMVKVIKRGQYQFWLDTTKTSYVVRLFRLFYLKIGSEEIAKENFQKALRDLPQ